MCITLLRALTKYYYSRPKSGLFLFCDCAVFLKGVEVAWRTLVSDAPQRTYLGDVFVFGENIIA
jgi:hypothetical protein